MKVEKRGEGDPCFTVIGSVHGDEPCGRRAIKRILSEDIEFRKPVQFVIANEKALEQNQRFVEADLNRSFPGDRNSDLHEERLAAEIMEVVEDTLVLDLHSTRSYPEPFATFSLLNANVADIVKATGVKNAVHFPEQAGAMNEHVDGIVVECGHQGTDQAAKNAYKVTKNFLACQDVIEGRCNESDPTLFRHTRKVEGTGFEFLAENFDLVEEGEVYARRADQELSAPESFYPVLMSTDGYEDIIGNMAEKLGKLSEVT